MHMGVSNYTKIYFTTLTQRHHVDGDNIKQDNQKFCLRMTFFRALKYGGNKFASFNTLDMSMSRKFYTLGIRLLFREKKNCTGAILLNHHI